MQHYKVDWAKVRIDFVQRGMTVLQCAEKWGVSHTSVGKRCAKDGWVRDREQYERKQTNAKADQIIAQVHARGADVTYIAEGMETEVRRCIELLGEEGLSTQNRYNLIQCVKFAYGLIKDIRGLLTRAEMEKLDIARQELQMKQEEHQRLMNQDLIAQEPIKVIIGGGGTEDMAG